MQTELTSSIAFQGRPDQTESQDLDEGDDDHGADDDDDGNRSYHRKTIKVDNGDISSGSNPMKESKSSSYRKKRQSEEKKDDSEPPAEKVQQTDKYGMHAGRCDTVGCGREKRYNPRTRLFVALCEECSKIKNERGKGYYTKNRRSKSVNEVLTQQLADTRRELYEKSREFAQSEDRLRASRGMCESLKGRLTENQKATEFLMSTVDEKVTPEQIATCISLRNESYVVSKLDELSVRLDYNFDGRFEQMFQEMQITNRRLEAIESTMSRLYIT